MENDNKCRCLLQRIANTIYVNHQYVEQPGLLNGYIGIILFLYHYSRYTHFDNYKELADELVDLTYSRLNKGMATDFANGLSGIGWGFKYLKNNHFIEMDDDVLEEIDTVVCTKSIADLLKETENDIPLYSEGLYWIGQDLNKEKVGMIYSRLYELSSLIKNKVLPVQYLNSILYTLLGLKRSGYAIDKLSDLYNLYRNMALRSLELTRCDEIDAPILKVLTSQFNYIDLVEKDLPQKDPDNEYFLNCNPGGCFGWQSFLFFRGRESDWMDSNFSQLERNVLDRISNLNIKDLSLSGLSGIGLNLMLWQK